ncbi:MAG: DoxX family protein [Gammaproteobacteria bacterium]|nr:DoxX family protein [Gammaproteobacteria bacterium]|tara:strand:- start:123 stop:545 length:423 start_codon:yes stop_codon:yes gene_type:complete
MRKLNNLLESIAKPLIPITPWLLRLGLGTSFILHGIGKFPLPPEKMVTWFESMGYMQPEIVTSLVALGEVGAGAGIILGGLINNHVGNLITRLSGGAVGVIMLGAIFIAHSDWLVTKKLFMSEQIFLFLIGLYFAIKGNK